jgi:hypothetical protein
MSLDGFITGPDDAMEWAFAVCLAFLAMMIGRGEAALAGAAMVAATPTTASA